MTRKKVATTAEEPKKAARKPATKKKTAATAAPAPAQVLQAKAPPAPSVNVSEIIEQLRRGDLASRSAAATRLGQLGDPHAGSALAEALRDPTAELACEAASALGHLSDSSAIHALIAVVLNSDGYFHNSVRIAAATSLGQLVDPRSVDALVAAIRDPICETSLAAIQALGSIGDSRARLALEETVSNADGFFLPQVQSAAAEALGMLRD